MRIWLHVSPHHSICCHNFFISQSLGVRIEYYVLVCYEEAGPALYWKMLVFAYLEVLQILGIMLAFQTRKVEVTSLKDSTFVAVNVYISSIVIVVFILVTAVLRSYLNVYSMVFAGGIFIITTSFLILSFIPKVHSGCYALASYPFHIQTENLFLLSLDVNTDPM